MTFPNITPNHKISCASQDGWSSGQRVQSTPTPPSTLSKIRITLFQIDDPNETDTAKMNVKNMMMMSPASCNSATAKAFCRKPICKYKTFGPVIVFVYKLFKKIIVIRSDLMERKIDKNIRKEHPHPNYETFKVSKF